jgi:hypothetical protein
VPVLEKMPVATVKGNRVPSQEAAQPYGGYLRTLQNKDIKYGVPVNPYFID